VVSLGVCPHHNHHPLPVKPHFTAPIPVSTMHKTRPFSSLWVECELVNPYLQSYSQGALCRQNAKRDVGGSDQQRTLSRGPWLWDCTRETSQVPGFSSAPPSVLSTGQSQSTIWVPIIQSGSGGVSAGRTAILSVFQGSPACVAVFVVRSGTPTRRGFLPMTAGNIPRLSIIASHR